MDWRSKEITEILERALAEDLGPGDLTTDATVPENLDATGSFLAKGALVVAGLPLVERLYELLDPRIGFTPVAAEGALVARGVLAEVRGNARALLRAERTALNFLQRLSGIATLTRRFVLRLEGTRARLLDTRKTTPGLRLLERYAVRVGGGANHRFGLYDAVLIKDNHARLAGGVGEAVRRARARYGAAQKIEAEVRDEAEVRQGLEAGADVLLLDNMTPDEVRHAVRLIQGRAAVEVSGGVTLENIRDYAEAGVDFISVGALTHSAPAVDIGFDLIPAGEHGA
ncbi:MAG TPA: carboxylating nicotinate-nucleotide diphosphorylase [Candidatus Xenobia bacterium]|nr:carboxylating nicotinate-nucleotide diphosphorylase [Candidatus Xenobia bacterium]